MAKDATKIVETIKFLRDFRKNSSIGGKDTKKHWIIDKEEDHSLVIVIELLKDCI